MSNRVHAITSSVKRHLFQMLFPCLALPLSALSVPAQTPVTPRVVSQTIDPKNRVVLQGNVHPLVRTTRSFGAVEDAKPLRRMLLLLKRSPAQEAALSQLLDDQQNYNSPHYHQWLTPEQFGAQFGPSDSDIQAVTSWLLSQGFQLAHVSKSRLLVEFSGTAGQVRSAFNTQIERYVINGEEHIANSSDPQIPAALAPVVAGIVSLHDFSPVSHVRSVGTFRRSRTGETTPLFTPTGSSTFFPLAPADFAKIYNVAPLLAASPAIDGSGQTIAVIGETDIHLQDVTDFRNIFNLPQNFTPANVILDGPDPGFNSTETESDLDVQWSGAVAPGATIKFVTSAPTETTSGVHLSAVYAVDNNLAGIISESFGQCEQALGATGNQFFNSLWQQAAAQGITAILSTGDGGSAGCDDFNTQQTAKQGLAVSGFASTPYNVAVGGTDFDQINRWSQFWNLTNDPVTQASAKGYIPEIPWNDSCAQLGISGCGSSAPQGSLNIVAGSGGPSTIYAKPSWQSASGVPSDGKRDIPDVSLLASNGFTGSLYLVCQADFGGGQEPGCTTDAFGVTIQGIGGTSASAPAFAGIMALVNQSQATAANPSPRQGNANYVLYALARQQASAAFSCDSSTGPDSRCTFNDITNGNSALAGGATGTNSVPCSGGTPNCSSSVSGVNGVLVDPAHITNEAWTANTGYDLVTGLGSINAANIAGNWGSIKLLPSSTTLTASVNGNTVSSISGLTHGQTVNLTSTVSAAAGASGTPTGQVALLATPNPQANSNSTSLGFESLTLTGGATTGTGIVLPGGAYGLSAHYSGDGSFGPSDSTPPIPVTITPEASKTILSIPTFDSTGAHETTNTPTSLVYGTTLYLARVDVGNAQAALAFPPVPSCAPPACPTGTVTITDSLNGGPTAPLDAGTFALNSAGFAEDFPQLAGGTHQLLAAYAGDSSFNASTSAPLAVTVTPAATAIGPNNPPMPPTIATPFGLGGTLTTNSSGIAPSCNFTFLDGSTPLSGPVQCGGQPGTNHSSAFLQPSILVSQSTPGSHTYTIKFNGDSNYSPSVSAPITTQVFLGTATTLSVSSTNIQFGSSVTLTAVVSTGLAQGPPIPHAVSFNSGFGTVPGTVTYGPITDSSGNPALQATLMTSPQGSTFYSAIFAGDSNYNGSGSSTTNVNVNIPDFSLGDLTPFNAPAGQPVTATITVTPASSTTSSVALACQAATVPEGVTCGLAPPSVSLSGGNPGTSILTLTVAAPSASSTVSVLPPAVPEIRTPFGRLQILQCSAAVILFVLAAFFLRARRLRILSAVAGAGVLVLFIGCGGGGGSSSGGGPIGGGNPPTPTSITLSTMNVKLPTNTPLVFTAKVTSSQAATGSVTLTDQTVGTLGSANLAADGTATFNVPPLAVGTYSLSASYGGDSRNLASKTTGSLSQVITGQTVIVILGTTGTLIHQTLARITIQ